MKPLLLVEVAKIMYPDSNDFGSTSLDRETPTFAPLKGGEYEFSEFGEFDSLAQLFKEALNKLRQ